LSALVQQACCSADRNNGFLLQPLARAKPLDIDILQQLYRTKQATDDTD